MASRSPLPSKRGQREDDDDEGRRRKKLEKGKEPAAKDADEEPLFDDSKFTVDLLRSAFRKLQGVGEAFDIKAHHDGGDDGNNSDDGSHDNDGGDDGGTPTN
jgi:hypothetical protein